MTTHKELRQIHGFSSVMKFIIFLIYVPFVFSATHTFMTTYVGINGQSSGIPEFSAVTTLDGQQIDYYDSEIKKLIPRQDWMKEFASGDTWKEDTEIREVVQQIYKYNILRLIERFNQTRDVYTYQRIYGCEWDDQTEDSHGFDQYGYDGEDLISLDLKELVYITAVPQGLITTTKWNNDRAQLVHLKEYYRHECVFWLKEFLKLREGNLKKIAPQVSLLQKDSSSPVVCHATGFYPPAVTITWLRNGEEHYEDVDLGETLPNEDGTFQKTSTLNVHPDDWKKNKYAIVVEHIERTFNTILPGDEIGTNRTTEVYSPILVCVIGVLIALVFAAAFIVMKKKRQFRTVSRTDDDGPNSTGL